MTLPESPRCAKPMLRYEASNGAMPEEPACARPEGHAGRCRSAAALARKYASSRARIASVRSSQGRRYGRAAELRGRAPGVSREAA